MRDGLMGDGAIRWGILGAGNIADVFCTDMRLTSDSVPVSVAARDGGRAAEFAQRHGCSRSYDSYEQLVEDRDVDVVYVATTHPSHRALALLAIEAGKAVVVEKPACLNAADARAVFGAARQAGVFAMEAMWARTNPLVRQAQRLVADGAVGEVRRVRSEYGLGLPFDPRHRLYDLHNGGGALVDLGIYPATLALLFLGIPDHVRAFGKLASTGVDETVGMEWLYDGDPRGQIWTSISVAAPNEAAVMGTTGSITFLREAHRPGGLIVRSGDREYRVDDPIAGRGVGYEPEIDEVARCLRAGLLESPLITHADTIAMLEILDDVRAQIGVVYP